MHDHMRDHEHLLRRRLHSSRPGQAAPPAFAPFPTITSPAMTEPDAHATGGKDTACL
jgi:hypothetical protein